MTTGEANRRLVLNMNNDSEIPEQRTYYNRSISTMRNNKDIDKYGYRSRHGISWLGGPTDKVCRQHIPRIYHIYLDYQGTIPSLVAENIIGKSFARTTKGAINQKRNLSNTFDSPIDKKYTSSYHRDFSEKRERRFLRKST